MSTIGKLALGALIDRGANRLLDRDKFNKNQFNILTGGGITGQGDEEKNTGSKTLGGIAKTGIMSLIANAIFGPVFAPLALSLGQKFVDNRRAQGLGLNPFGGDGGDGPPGPGITKALTQEEIYDMDDVDPADYGLVDAGSADIQDFADIMPEDSGSDNGGGGGGGNTSSDQGETSSDSGFGGSGQETQDNMYARGGRASYFNGGLASLYR